VLLTQTFTGSHKIDSGKVNLQLNVDAQGDSSLKGPIKVSLTGPFATAGAGELPRFDLALDAHAADQGITAGLTSTSDRLFVKLGGTAYEVPATLLSQLKQSYKQQSQQKSGSNGLSSLGIHPMNWLKDPTVVGTESVGGVDTEHVSAQLDVNALLDDVDGLLAKFHDKIPAGAAGAGQIPDKLPADTRQKIVSAVKSAKVDVWTGKDDKTLRKLALALSIEPTSGSLKSATVDLSVEIDDLNAPQTIEAPSDVHPLTELLGQVQGLLGSSGLGGSSFGGGSSGAGSSKQVDKYAQCLQNAGGDATKIQKCASLLTH
jgi:ribosomal protein L12E/L44/L45/RPP1/RPP2